MVPVATRAQLAGEHRLSVDDVRKLVEAGIVEENGGVELVEGVLLDMVPIGPEHEGAVEWPSRGARG